MGNLVTTDLDYQGPITGTQHTESRLTTLNSTFGGVTGLIEVGLLTSGTNSSNGYSFSTNTTGKTYYKVVSPGVIAQYGTSVTAVTFGQSVATTTSYAPPYVNGAANLAIGETGTYSYTGTLASSGPGSGPVSFSTTVKFVGKESITVPAGTFNACRYDTLGTSGAVTATGWYYRSIVIKSSTPSTSGTQIIQLKAATINGASI